MDKVKRLFSSKENLILFCFSLLLGLNSLLFAFWKTNAGSPLKIPVNSSFIFIVYFILSVLVAGTIAFFSQKFELKKIVEKIILTYSIAEIILLYSLEKMTCLEKSFTCLATNNIMPAFTVIYFILIGYLIIVHRRNKKTSGIKKIDFQLKKRSWISLGIILAVFILNLSFGLYHLSEKASVDEALWTFDRIPKFWNNILDGEWHKTRISDKPGITVALISGAGLTQINPKDYKSISWQGEIYSPQKNIENMNFDLRFPILFFNAIMLFVFYFLIKKLLGEKTAVISVIFIGLSPLLLGISTIINPDSLLWTFLPLSMLSYLVYRKEDSNAYLYWAGIFLGLAILTKYVANILYVFFFLLIFLEYIFSKDNLLESTAKYLKKSLIDYLVLIFFSLLTFFVLLPASWTSISKLLEGTILSEAFQKVWPIFLAIIVFIIIDIVFIKGRVMSAILNFISKYKKLIFISVSLIFLISILATFANTYLGMKWSDFEAILASPKSSYENGGFLGLFGANFYSLVFGIMPLALLSIVFLLTIKMRAKKEINIKESTALYFSIFILLYYFASTVNNVSATVRYQIVIYPIAFIIAAIGISEFLSIEKVKKYVPEYLAYSIIILFSIYSLNFIRPFYFCYASDLLPKQYVLNLKDMGDGSYEAAQYLNKLPNAKILRIWSDKRGVCTFFQGSCSSSIDNTKNGESFDYFVVSSGRETRTTKMTISRVNGGNTQMIRLDKLYTIPNSETFWKLEIGGRKNNFVKIIEADKILVE